MIGLKDVNGRYKDLVLWFVRRMLRRLLIGWSEATCPYDEASALSSCQTDLIGQDGNLVFSSWTRLIGLSNGLVLIRTLLIGRSADQLPASSLGFFATRCQTVKRDLRENNYAKASSLGDEYAVLICSCRQNRQNECHLVLLTLLVVEYIYCALCSLMELGKCVCCSWLVMMSTCSEYYD